MTLQASGAISLANISTEFGGTGAIALQNYYAGGSYVSAGTANGTSVAIPSSGAISFANFYGATKFVAVTHTYNANTTETIPAGATTVVIELWGASGQGGAGAGTGCGITGGGGAGSGGYSRSSYSVSALGGAGKTFSVFLGTAGVGSGSSNVIAGTVTGYTGMTAGNGGLGGNAPTGTAGTAGTTGTGGNQTNSAGSAGASGGCSSGAGGAAVTGVNGTGNPGGHGGLGASQIGRGAGGTGVAVFRYT